MTALPKKAGHGRGKKPIDLVASAGYLSPQDAVWSAIRQLKYFTQEEIEIALEKQSVDGIHPDTVRSYLKRLDLGDYITVDSYTHAKKIAKRIRYRLVKDTGVQTPRIKKDGTPSTQGRGRENLWRAMNVLGNFNYRDLLETANTDEVTVKVNEAKDYIGHLYRANYLRMIKKACQRTGMPAVYKLPKSKYTGPLPPKVQRTKQIFDPNLNEVVWRQQEKQGVDND